MQIYITKNGQQLGPYSLTDAQGLVAAGQLASNDWAWCEGAADWMPLHQVPGYAAAGAVPAPGTPPVYAPGAVVAAERPRRPVLVWIICLLYFVFTPIGIISIAAMPFLVPMFQNLMHKTDANMQSAIDRTTDPAARDRLIQAQQSIRNSSDIFGRFSSASYILIGEVISILNLSAAIALFLLRRIALPLFIAAFALSFCHMIYLYFFEGLIHSLGPQLVTNIISLAFGWAFSIAILLYVWHLSRKGILR